MEYSKEEPTTPIFGYAKDNKALLEEKLGKRIPRSTNDVSKYTNYGINEENKNETNEKNTSKENSSKYNKKKVSGISLPIDKKYENPFEIFLKKKLTLRNDFDQDNAEKFLAEKELAFQQFRMNENADYLDN